MMCTQRDQAVESPGAADLFPVGTAGMIVRIRKLPDGRTKVLVQGLVRARILGVDPQADYLRATVVEVEEPPTQSIDLATEGLIRTVHDQLDKLAAMAT